MLCVVAHDAGGAEIISSHIRRKGLVCRYVLAGPAQKVFERKLGPLERTALEDGLRHSDRLLCGTSWQSDLEWCALGIARDQGKPSIAFLDHWVNYRERFVRNGETRLPDEIWVGDVLARDMAREIFPGLPVRHVDNPYFEDLRRELVLLPRSVRVNPKAAQILYVCEPLREHALRQYGDERHWGYTEEDALRYFLTHLDALGTPVERVVVRPHPAESPDKYAWAEQKFDLPIIRGGDRPLFEEIVDSDWVVGCESMAMVVGLLAGKRVLSCIPPGGRLCTLPQYEIEHLQTLVKRSHSTSPGHVNEDKQ